MSDNNHEQNINNHSTNAPAADNSGQNDKMFTQDEVNRIVSERLNRDREKRLDTQNTESREKALQERESRLSCREYVAEKKYKSDLLDILDTSDVNKFKTAADKIHELYGVENEQRSTAARFTSQKTTHENNVDPLRKAFLSAK